MSLLTSLFRIVHARKYKALADIPGPKPQFPLGNLLDLISGEPLWRVLARYAIEYGPISVMWIGSKPSVVLNDPDAIAHVLLDKDELPHAEGSSETQTSHPSDKGAVSRCPVHRFLPTSQADFYKNLPRKALLPMLTDNSPFIARDAGKTWTRLSDKDPFNQPYFEDWLSSQVHPLQEFLETRAAELVGQSEVEMLPTYETLQKMTFDGFSLAVDGRIFPSEVYEEFCLMCDAGTQRMSLSTTLGNWAIPTEPRSKRYRQASQKWYALFDRVVQDTRAASPTQSLLQWMKEYSSDDFTEQQLRDYCAGIYPGGAVSVPSAIVNALHLLWQHPDQMMVLQQALDDLMVAPLTYDRLNNCLPLEQVMRETLRLFPAVPFFTRNVRPDKSIQLGDYEIPANTQLFINNWFLHRHSSHWDTPEAFKPERWDRATIEANPFGSRYYFPFGRGKRACIGQTFAQYTIKLTLAVLLAKLDVQFGDEPNQQEYHFAVAVPRKVRATFSYRPPTDGGCHLTHRFTQESLTQESHPQTLESPLSPSDVSEPVATQATKQAN
ncbi:MAG: cytochrome P450 [Cyanobacteria bacterium P01_A01_bin.3]